MRILLLLRFTLPISFLIFSCEDPNYPENIWDENDQGNASPSISSVEPEAAFAGIDTLTINGQNFSENTSENLVYFNNMLGEVINATSTSLRVITPNLVSDSVKIRVAVQGAFLFADHSSLYTLTAIVHPYKSNKVVYLEVQTDAATRYRLPVV